jgi:hypothetical protein
VVRMPLSLLGHLNVLVNGGVRRLVVFASSAGPPRSSSRPRGGGGGRTFAFSAIVLSGFWGVND